MDDKVCMHYIVDRLEDIIKADSIELSYERVLSFKDELEYNLIAAKAMRSRCKPTNQT